MSFQTLAGRKVGYGTGHLPAPEDLPLGVDPPRPISVTFIPASVFDNPALLRVNPEYLAWLLSAAAARARAAAGRQLEDPAGGRALFQAGMVYHRRPSPGGSRRCALLGSRGDRNDGTQRPRLDGRHQARPRQAPRLLAAGCGARAGQPGRCGEIAAQHRAPRRQNGSTSGSARIRGRPARARSFTWCAR